MDKITPASRCAMDKHHHRASGFANADVCQAGSVGLQALMAHAHPIAHMRGKVSISLAAQAGRDADHSTTGKNHPRPSDPPPRGKQVKGATPGNRQKQKTTMQGKGEKERVKHNSS